MRYLSKKIKITIVGIFVLGAFSFFIPNETKSDPFTCGFNRTTCCAGAGNVGCGDCVAYDDQNK